VVVAAEQRIRRAVVDIVDCVGNEEEAAARCCGLFVFLGGIEG
jgi:hypothetical protein